jgi:3-isopropylmalate/(R)-2-methylmalate dehydratase small subunit
VWKFGDHLRSNHFLAGKYDPLGRAGKFEELARHVLEDVDPDFVRRVKPGDLLVVGDAFGTGKHLDGPINAFKSLGIAAVLGKGFSASWERDSINLGLPSLVYPELFDLVEDGDVIELDLRASVAQNLTRGTSVRVLPTPEGVLSLLEAGGIASYTAKRLGIEDRPKAKAAGHA